MTIEKFNTKAGLSVGPSRIDVIDANANATFTTVVSSSFSGDGGKLSNIAGSNVSGQVANALVAGTVYNSSQPNITSLGTLTSLAVSGDVNAVNMALTGSLILPSGATFTADEIVSTGDIAAAGNMTTGNISATGGIFTYVRGNGANLSAITGANVTGAVAFASTANSVAGANVTGVVANATHAVSSTTANVANSVAGANVSGQVANALVAGTVYTSAQPNITSVGTLTSLAVTGGVTAASFSGDGANLSAITGANVTGTVANATHAVSSTTANVANSVAGANVTGTVASATVAASANSVAGTNVSGQVANALVAGTVYTSVQPNITSVGTLTSLAVSGTTNLGAVGNVTITGGTSGQVLQTNGSGGLTWATVGAGSLANGTSSVAMPISDGNVNISVGGVSNVLVVTTTGANIAGTLNATGEVTGGSLSVTGTSNLGAVGNITITGGTTGQVLTTNGSGVLTWSTAAAGGVANGTSNVSVPTVDGNVNTSVGGVANVFVVTSTGANVAGTMNVTGDTVIGGTLTVTGTLTGNITGANMANFAGSVTTNAQPNITSVGTLTSLSVTGDVTATSFAGDGGNLSNIQGSNVTSVASGNLTATTVQAAINELDSEKLSLSGGALTGDLTLAADPTVALGAATKQYVDAKVTGPASATDNAIVRYDDVTGKLVQNSVVTISDTGSVTGVTDLAVSGNLTVAGDMTVNGRYVASLTSGLTTVVDINCSLDNYFKITVASAQTFSATNVPTTGSVYSMTLEILTNAGAAITWPASVYWPNGSAPTLSATGKTTLIMMVTTDGGVKWRASSLIDYTT